MNSPARGRNSGLPRPAQPLRTRPQALAQAPQAGRVEADDHDPAFGHQHALDLAQRLVRVARQLQRVRQHHQVEALAAGTAARRSRNAARPARRRGVARRRPAPASRRLGRVVVVRHPAMRHAVGAQRVEFRQAELQRMEAEHVGHARSSCACSHGEQVAARRRSAARRPNSIIAASLRHAICVAPLAARILADPTTSGASLSTAAGRDSALRRRSARRAAHARSEPCTPACAASWPGAFDAHPHASVPAIATGGQRAARPWKDDFR